MIKHTIEIPHLGMTFDASQVQTTDIDYDYDEAYSWQYTTPKVYRSGHTARFLFKDGTSLEIRNAKYNLKIEIELVEGRIYHIGKDGEKWLALCQYDDMTDELVLKPLRPGVPTASNTNRLEYEFYKEFDLDLKEYL